MKKLTNSNYLFRRKLLYLFQTKKLLHKIINFILNASIVDTFSSNIKQNMDADKQNIFCMLQAVGLPYGKVSLIQ